MPIPTHVAFKALLTRMPAGFPDTLTGYTPLHDTLSLAMQNALLFRGYRKWVQKMGWEAQTLMDLHLEMDSTDAQMERIKDNGYPFMKTLWNRPDLHQSHFFALGHKLIGNSQWVLFIHEWDETEDADYFDRELIAIRFNRAGEWEEVVSLPISVCYMECCVESQIQARHNELHLSETVLLLESNIAFNLYRNICSKQTLRFQPNGSWNLDTVYCSMQGHFYNAESRELLFLETDQDTVRVLYKPEFQPIYTREGAAPSIQNLPEISRYTHLPVSNAQPSARTCTVRFPKQSGLVRLTMSPNGESLRAEPLIGGHSRVYHQLVLNSGV